MKRRATKDAELIVSIVGTALMLRHSVAQEVADMLANYRQRLRENRKWLRHNATSRPESAKWREKDCRRILATSRRLRKLAKLYATFRGEHPEACLPPERMRRG